MTRAALALLVAVLAISWGAPLARLTAAAPLAVAMWRMTLSAGFLLPLGAPRAARLGRDDLLWAGFAGLLLGLHFGLWIPSLWLTSVSASVVLVSTQPLWVLLMSPRLLGAPIGRRNIASLLLALVGVAVITGGDFNVSMRALVGDVMALAAAVAMAGYLVVGKRLRGSVPLVPYLTVVYGGAAVSLIVAALGLGVSVLPRNAVSWLPLLGMAVGPTLVGHSLLNWALAHVPAYRVNLTVLLEPILASGWTWLVLGEVPPIHVAPGAALILGALALEFLPAGDVEAATSRP